MWIVISLGMIPIGGLVLASVAAARAVEGERRVVLERVLIAFGCLLFVLAGGMLLLAGLAIRAGLSDDEAAAALFATALAVVLLGPAGVLEILVALGLKQGGRDAGRTGLTALTIFGLLLVFGPLLALLPPFAGILVAALVVVATHARRSRQGNLLWLLAIAVDQGIPLPDEVEALADSVRGRKRLDLLRLAADLRDGTSLSDALEATPSLVPRPAILAVRVGEQTGTLAAALKSAAVRQTALLQQSSSGSYLIGAVAYFWIVCVVLMSVVTFCMYYIVPKYKAILDDFGVEVPHVTFALIEASDLFIQHWYLFMPLLGAIVAGFVALGVGYYVGWESVAWKRITRWFPRWDVPDILRDLSLAVSTQTPLPPVLDTLAEHHHRGEVRQRLATAAGVAAQGGDVWRALSRERMLRPSEVQLLDSAARVGNLPWVLNDLAGRIEQRRQYRLQWWFEVLRPWPVILLAFAVGFYVVGMFEPLVTLIMALS